MKYSSDIFNALLAMVLGGGSGGGGSGGGGEGGGGNVLVVPLTLENNGYGGLLYTATKTAGEMFAADSLVYVYEHPGVPGSEIKVVGANASLIPGTGYGFAFVDPMPVQGADPTIMLFALSENDYPASEGLE